MNHLYEDWVIYTLLEKIAVDVYWAAPVDGWVETALRHCVKVICMKEPYQSYLKARGKEISAFDRKWHFHAHDQDIVFVEITGE